MAYEYVPYNGPIVERQFAKANDLKRYFTGKPCKRGHLAERLVSTFQCDACMAERKITFAEKIAKQFADWQRNNPEKVKIRNSKWEQKNKKKRAAISDAYRKRHPERARATRASCDARRRGAEGFFTKSDILQMGENQKWKCQNCHVCIKKKYHVDHINPIAKGGTSWPSNLQLLCPPCNMSKGAMDPFEWAEKNGNLFP